MLKAHLEEVNGSFMLVLPPIIVDRLKLAAGSEVEVTVEDGALLVRQPVPRRRLRLADLLSQTEPSAFERTDEDHEFLESPPVGRELI